MPHHTGLCALYGCACTQEDLLEDERDDLKEKIRGGDKSKKTRNRLRRVEYALNHPKVETAEIVTYRLKPNVSL